MLYLVRGTQFFQKCDFLAWTRFWNSFLFHPLTWSSRRMQELTRSSPPIWQFLIEHTIYPIELFEEGLGCVTSLPKCISDHLQLILLLLLCMKTWINSLHQKNSTLHLTHHPQLDVCSSALDLKHLMTWRGFWNQAPWLPIFLFLLFKYNVQIECFSQFMANA